jgi:hypothetical protein
MHIDQNSSYALVKVRGRVPLLRGSGQALWQRGTDRTVEVGCGVLLLECGQLHAGLAGQPPPPLLPTLEEGSMAGNHGEAVHVPP